MNRIREIRKLMKVARRRLAARLGVADRTLQRWEEGETPITLDRLEEIARALDVPFSRLIVQGLGDMTEDDVAPVADMPGVEGIGDMLAATDVVVYRVLTPAVAAVDARLSPGRTIFVSVSDARLAARKAGDVLLVEAAFGATRDLLLLRQFLPPALLVSNTPNSPHESTIKLTDRTFRVRIRGIVLLPGKGKDGLQLGKEPDLDAG